MTEPEIAIWRDEEAVAWAAADLIASVAAQSDDFCIALAGGDTPRLLYRTLASEPYVSRIQWKNWHVWWGDERSVPPDAPESNYNMAREAMLDRLPIQPHVHRIIGETASEAAARAYERELRNYFDRRELVMDLVLLGIGEDGHTAGLFPGSSVLQETRRLVAPGIAPQNPRARVTLTLPMINAARHVIFLVTGREKASALRAVVAADREDASRPPAALVQPASGHVHHFVDEAAASYLTGAPAR